MRDGAGARWEVGGVRVCVFVNGRDLVRKRPAMDHLPSAKVPPLTGSSHVLRCELGARTRGGGGGGGEQWVEVERVQEEEKGNPERCNFKLGCTHKMHAASISYIYGCTLSTPALLSDVSVCHTGHGNSGLSSSSGVRAGVVDGGRRSALKNTQLFSELKI